MPLDVVKSVRVQYPEDESLAVPLIKYVLLKILFQGTATFEINYQTMALLALLE